MYHDYPSWGREEALGHSPALPPESYMGSKVDSIYHRITSGARAAQVPYHLSLRYEPAYGAHYELRSGSTLERYALDGERLAEARPTQAVLDAVAALWADSHVRIDTITDLDQWTPFDRLREDLPFYRLSLSRDGREVYISSRDGRVLTEHTRSERIWSWLGAIPHWVYFTQIRQSRDLWTWIIIVLSGLGTLMLLGGIYVGVDVYWRTRKSRRGAHSPYTKRAYRWHHILGTAGGLFMLAWCFSGLMSVVEVSTSLDHDEAGRVAGYFRPRTILPEGGVGRAMAGIRTGAKELSWTAVGTIPILRAAYSDEDGAVRYEYWRVANGEVEPLALTEQEIRDQLSRALPEGAPYTLEHMQAYDSYYVSTSGSLPLPIYKMIPKDSSLPYVYLNPQSGEVRTISRSARVRMWLYNKPHSLRFACFAERPALREAVMWLLLLLGTAVSATGIILSVRYIRRKV